MRIGFDATTFNLTKGSTSVYLSNLLLALKQVAPYSKILNYSPVL
jgi:hypothetical protein